MPNLRLIIALLVGLSVLGASRESYAEPEAVKGSSSTRTVTTPGSVDVRIQVADRTSDLIEGYKSDLIRRLKRAWFPAITNKPPGIVVVSFRISVNGEMSNLELQTKSLNPSVDTAATRCVENASPFRPLPQGIKEMADVIVTFKQPVELPSKALDQKARLKEVHRSNKLVEPVVERHNGVRRGDFGSSKLDFAPGLGLVRHKPPE